MNTASKVALFLLWLALVTLGCLDMAYSSPSVFGTIVLPIAGWPFMSKAQFTKDVRGKELWVGLAAVILVLGLIIWGALSGFNQTSNAWSKEHPDFRFYFALALWFAWLGLGVKLFRAKRFLA